MSKFINKILKEANINYLKDHRGWRIAAPQFSNYIGLKIGDVIQTEDRDIPNGTDLKIVEMRDSDYNETNRSIEVCDVICEPVNKNLNLGHVYPQLVSNIKMVNGKSVDFEKFVEQNMDDKQFSSIDKATASRKASTASVKYKQKALKGKSDHEIEYDHDKPEEALEDAFKMWHNDEISAEDVDHMCIEMNNWRYYMMLHVYLHNLNDKFWEKITGMKGVSTYAIKNCNGSLDEYCNIIGSIMKKSGISVEEFDHYMEDSKINVDKYIDEEIDDMIFKNISPQFQAMHDDKQNKKITSTVDAAETSKENEWSKEQLIQLTTFVEKNPIAAQKLVDKVDDTLDVESLGKITTAGLISHHFSPKTINL